MQCPFGARFAPSQLTPVVSTGTGDSWDAAPVVQQQSGLLAPTARWAAVGALGVAVSVGLPPSKAVAAAGVCKASLKKQ